MWRDSPFGPSWSAPEGTWIFLCGTCYIVHTILQHGVVFADSRHRTHCWADLSACDLYSGLAIGVSLWINIVSGPWQVGECFAFFRHLSMLNLDIWGICSWTKPNKFTFFPLWLFSLTYAACSTMSWSGNKLVFQGKQDTTDISVVQPESLLFQATMIWPPHWLFKKFNGWAGFAVYESCSLYHVNWKLSISLNRIGRGIASVCLLVAKDAQYWTEASTFH